MILAGLYQVGAEQAIVDIAVGGAVGSVAEVAIFQLVAEQGDDPVLGGAFGFADLKG